MVTRHWLRAMVSRQKALLIILAVSISPGLAQKGGSSNYIPPPPVSTIPAAGPRIAGDSPDALWEGDPDLRHRMLVARRTEMKRHMEDNAERLVKLTRELQSDLLEHEPSPADGKRLDEIAKLARAVRDGMKQ